MKRMTKMVLMAGLVAAVAACSGGDDEETNSPRGGPPGGGGGGDVVVSVESVKVERGEFRVTADYAGEFRSEGVTEVSSDVAGRVIGMNFNIGDEVTEGEVLAQINDTSLRQAVRELEANVAVARANREEAQVNLENLESNLRRKKPLRERDMVTEREIEEIESSIRRAKQQVSVAEATIEQNEARLSSAREDLRNTEIRAPFDAKIGMRYVDRGTHVSPGQTIFSLVDDDDLFVSIQVPERQAPRVHAQTPVTMRVGVLGGAPLTGEIHRIAPSLDSSTRSLRVDVTAGDTEGLHIRPGMYARVNMELGRSDDALTVSNQAILRATDGEFYAWKIDDDQTVVRQTLELGLRGREKSEIVEGLAEGDRIVLRGHEKLEEGTKVRDLRASDSDAPMPEPSGEL